MVKNIKDKIEQIAISSTDMQLLMPSISFCCNKQAVIQGCKGVLHYDENLVKLNCAKLILQFSGTALTINAVGVGEIIIRGEILSLEFLN